MGYEEPKSRSFIIIFIIDIEKQSASPLFIVTLYIKSK